MSVYFSGDPDRLAITITALTEPISIAGWFKVDNNSEYLPLAYIRNPTGLLSYYGLELDGGDADYPLRASERISLSTQAWSDFAYTPANTWVQVLGVFDTNFRLIYRNGTPSYTNTTAMGSPSDTKVVEIGKRNVYLGDNIWLKGYAAEVSLWNRKLSQDDATYLAEGKSALGLPDGLVFHAKLKDDLYEEITERFLNSYGSPTQDEEDHPQIEYPGTYSTKFIIGMNI
jgi:hypothetical protein